MARIMIDNQLSSVVKDGVGYSSDNLIRVLTQFDPEYDYIYLQRLFVKREPKGFYHLWWDQFKVPLWVRRKGGA